jgi:hypothetical protein
MALHYVHNSLDLGYQTKIYILVILDMMTPLIFSEEYKLCYMDPLSPQWYDIRLWMV